MTNENYVQFILKKFINFKKLYLLHAISAYPTFFTDININIIKKYYKLSLENKNIIPGYSSHDVGSLGSMLAVAAGARMIEKHIKFGVTEWMHFDDTAIDVISELPSFVSDLIKVDKALGSEKKKSIKSNITNIKQGYLMKNILICTSSFDKKTYKIIFFSKSIKIKFNPFGRKLKEKELLNLIDDNTIGIISGTEIISKKIIQKAKKSSSHF